MAVAMNGERRLLLWKRTLLLDVAVALTLPATDEVIGGRRDGAVLVGRAVGNPFKTRSNGVEATGLNRAKVVKDGVSLGVETGGLIPNVGEGLAIFAPEEEANLDKVLVGFNRCLATFAHGLIESIELQVEGDKMVEKMVDSRSTGVLEIDEVAVVGSNVDEFEGVGAKGGRSGSGGWCRSSTNDGRLPGVMELAPTSPFFPLFKGGIRGRRGRGVLQRGRRAGVGGGVRQGEDLQRGGGSIVRMDKFLNALLKGKPDKGFEGGGGGVDKSERRRGRHIELKRCEALWASVSSSC